MFQRWSLYKMTRLNRSLGILDLYSLILEFYSQNCSLSWHGSRFAMGCAQGYENGNIAGFRCLWI